MNKVYTGEMGRLEPFDAKNPSLATVVVNRQLNQAGDRHLTHLELDISGSQIRYDSGDHVAVYPINDVSIVNRIGQILDADLDTVISLNNLEKESNKKHPFPCPTTYRTALTHYLDITNPPRTNVLFELAQYSTDPKDQDILRKMASASPEVTVVCLCLSVRVCTSAGCWNILAVLEDMPSLHPTIDHLCELLPRLQARYYSIASSGDICAVVVEFQTSTGRSFKGVATNWLKNKLVVTDNVRKSQFRLPFKASNPVVMIGPGTGIAPFMGFLQERGWMKEQGKDVGETILYFGCRHRYQDFMYQQELEELGKVGVLIQLNVAFSRDQEEKVTQHTLKPVESIGADARNMARDVQNAFYDIAEEVGEGQHIITKWKDVWMNVCCTYCFGV
uniref:NADPH--hemoprotein reductase n=1 Tax=Oncorhynchus mykiss TaxID=8022 RepID=A0A8K9X954_ONCMY